MHACSDLADGRLGVAGFDAVDEAGKVIEHCGRACRADVSLGQKQRSLLNDGAARPSKSDNMLKCHEIAF